MRKTILSAGAAAFMTFGLSAIPMAYAQGEGDAGTGFNAGHSAPAGPQCPAIGWHMQHVTTMPATVHGVAYYEDGSGTSTVVLNVAADGTMDGTLTSVQGNGPVGKISGKRTASQTVAQLVGAGCANAKFHIYRYRNGARLATPGGF